MENNLQKAVEIGFFILIAIMGGIVAHIRAFEASGVTIPVRAHIFSLIRRSIMAGFAGMLCYLAAQGWGYAESPWAYFAAGICGMFAAELFDLSWRLGKRWLESRVRLEDKAEPRSKRKAEE